MAEEVLELLDEMFEDLNYECEAVKMKGEPLWNISKFRIEDSLVLERSPCGYLSNDRKLNGVSLCRPCYKTIRSYQRLYENLTFRRTVMSKMEFLRWDIDNLIAQSNQNR